MHQRQVIRETIRSVLDGATDADDRVYASRMNPYRVTELPVLTVYSTSESVDDDSSSTSPRELTRRLSISIEGWVVGNDESDDAMDDLAEQVEIAMHADPYLGGSVGDSILSSTSTEITIDGDREMGLLTMEYTITYRTLAPEPISDAESDDYLRTDAVYTPEGLTEDIFDMRAVVES